MNLITKAILAVVVALCCVQIGILHGRALEREESVLEAPDGSDMALCQLYQDCDEDFMAVGESHDQR